MSIYNLDKYQEFVQSLLKRVPILQTEQLTTALVNLYDINYKESLEIMQALQNKGVLLLSVDGYAMTRAAFIRLIDSKRIEDAHTSVNYSYRLPEMRHLIEKDEYHLNLIDCMWIVVDMLPLSKNFVVCPEPWDIVFDVAEDENNSGRLYQITRIPSSKEDIRCELLRCLSPVPDYIKDKITRIAIMDNEEHNWMVPHIGFSHIVKLDAAEQRHYLITETREKDDIWR